MRFVWILAKNTWVEQLRSRFFNLIWIFGGVLLYASLLVGVLAVEEQTRVILDMGLALIELLCLAAAVFVAANSILREMELKTIYLILARPVPRGAYLIGRFLGLQLSVLTAGLVMAGMHLTLLFWRGWTWEPAYPLMLLGCFEKVFLVSSMTLCLSLLSTSVMSALTMTGILWALGHFTEEIRFLTAHPHTPIGWVLHYVNPLLPDLQAFNFRDFVPAAGAAPWTAATAAGYLVIYSGACLLFAYALFRNKEF